MCQVVFRHGNLFDRNSNRPTVMTVVMIPYNLRISFLYKEHQGCHVQQVIIYLVSVSYNIANLYILVKGKPAFKDSGRSLREVDVPPFFFLIRNKILLVFENELSLFHVFNCINIPLFMSFSMSFAVVVFSAIYTAISV